MTRTHSKIRNTRIIINRAVVRSRVDRWKNTDIGDSSLYGYTRKLKEFQEFCKNNEPAVLNTERKAYEFKIKHAKMPSVNTDR